MEQAALFLLAVDKVHQGRSYILSSSSQPLQVLLLSLYFVLAITMLREHLHSAKPVDSAPTATGMMTSKPGQSKAGSTDGGDPSSWLLDTFQTWYLSGQRPRHDYAAELCDFIEKILSILKSRMYHTTMHILTSPSPQHPGEGAGKITRCPSCALLCD